MSYTSPNYPNMDNTQFNETILETELDNIRKNLKKIIDDLEVKKYNYLIPKASNNVVDSLTVLFDGLLKNDEVVLGELQNIIEEIDRIKTRLTNLETRMDAVELEITEIKTVNNNQELRITALESFNNNFPWGLD